MFSLASLPHAHSSGRDVTFSSLFRLVQRDKLSLTDALALSAESDDFGALDM